MADLAIGLSKTTVEAVVNKVKSAITEEAELLQTVQRDLVFITDEFEMMQSFLNSAAADHIMNSNVVRTWVKQVRDLSYDTEDCIESVLHLDTKRSFWTLLRRLLVSCKPGGGPLPLDEVFAEIKLLKARVEDVSQRSMRYSLIGSDSSSSQAAVVQTMTASRARKLGIVNEARDTSKELSGFSDLAGLITNEDANDDRLQVISVWGTGDDRLGAVSMVKEAYDNPEVYKNFRYRAWVKLMHPLNPHKFMRTLVAQFYTNSCHEQQVIDGDVLTWVEATKGADLVEVFAKQVNQQRYLVVLEDLSSMAEWHAVRTYLPDTKNRSRIVISTQQHEIATSCIGHPYQVLELNHISENHSVCVFFKEGQSEEGRRRGGPCWRGPSYKVNEFRLVGRDSEVTKLDDLLLKDHMDIPRVVYVWGMAGVGKSALVKTIYRRWTHEKYAWVNVSYPFHLMDFCRSILLNMLSGAYRVTDPIQECRKLLHKDRCLLVIDGLHTKKDWDIIYTKLIREPSDWDMKLIRESCDPCRDDKYGSRLSCVVITTEEQIARHAVTSHDAACNVPVLKDDGALDLFKQVLYREMMAHVDEDMIRHVLDEEARVLLPNCGGHPSVIVALGRYLAHLHTLQRGIHDREWKRLNANMMRELETNPEFESLRGLFAQMRAKFQACPQILKKCILYLSVFPQNSIIRRRRLVRRWLAEGYSSGTDQQAGTSLDEGAEKLVDQLAQMAIIRAAAVARDSMRMTSWKVNSFLLDYIISHKEEGTLFLPLEVSVLEENCSLISTGRVGQHLAIGSSWKRDEFMFNSLDLSRLRSLTVVEQWEPFFISNKMRVLDLEGASNNLKNEDLEQIGEKLPRLKFLSLRGCRYVSLLPDSFGALRQLQTLDVRDTCVNALPKSIIKLFKLQYIRAGRSFAVPWIDDKGGLATREPSTSSISPVGTQLASYLSKSTSSGAQDGVRLPRRIGKLKALQTLGAVSVVSTAHGNAILAELQHHKQLKKLQLSGINQTNSRSMPFIFPGHLESLAIRGKVLPRNIRFPGNLMKLSLDVTILSTTPADIQVMLHAIGKLEKLHTLRLFLKMAVPTSWELQFLHAKPDHADSNAPSQFTELKVLEIGCTSGLCVRFDKEAVKKLEQLKVHRPNGSSLEFDGLKYLISLEQVCVKGYCDDTLKGHLQDQLTDHSKKPTLNVTPPSNCSERLSPSLSNE